MRTLALATVALALGCGDTLVDHTSTEYFDTGTGATCAPPNHVCAAACVPEDASSCGDSCQVCTAAPAGARPACVNHACDFECTDGRLRDGGACVGVVAVAAGLDHTCAILEGGSVKCWGSNASGQLGTGGGVGDVTIPTGVAGITAGATAISAGWAHTCAVVSGQVRCWGANDTGQLGDATTTPRPTPVPVSLSDAAVAVAAGELHTCALLVSGAVHCWGANGFGQLGKGGAPTNPAPTPGNAALLPDAASAIAAGRTHTCAIVAGAVFCWGKDADGQVGNGLPVADAVTTPTAVVKQAGGSLTGATDVRGGELHTCAAVLNGADEELWCWGANALGQAGFNPDVSIHYPAAMQPTVISNPRASLVAAGNAHSCALRSQDSLKCFGSNSSGQLGTASPDPGPPLNSDVTSFGTATTLPAQITAGGAHTCAVLAEGTLYCWGSNAHGQLGDGTTTQRFVPTSVSGR